MERLSMFQASLEKLMVLNQMESDVMEGFWSLTGRICSLICTRLFMALGKLSWQIPL
jgi:hypothetical protein